MPRVDDGGGGGSSGPFAHYPVSPVVVEGEAGDLIDFDDTAALNP